MKKRGFFSLLFLLLLAATVGRAQNQPGLVGRWALQQIIYEAYYQLPDSLQQKLLHSPAAATNESLKAGQLTAEVEFRADGTYRYVLTRAGKPFLSEQGRYELHSGNLQAVNAEAGAESSFNGQHVNALSGRKLWLDAHMWGAESQVFEQRQFRRLPPKK